MEVYILYKKRLIRSENWIQKQKGWSTSSEISFRIFWHQKALVIKDQWIPKISCVIQLHHIPLFMVETKELIIFVSTCSYYSTNLMIIITLKHIVFIYSTSGLNYIKLFVLFKLLSNQLQCLWLAIICTIVYYLDWRRITCKHNARWLQITRLKASTVYYSF